MKIAFYTNEKQLSRLAKAKLLSMDYFSMEDRLLHTLELQERVVNETKEEANSYMEKFNRLKTRIREEFRKAKYVACFNGQTCVWDMQDIVYLESYYRKASVVLIKGKYRIRARLNEEEKKLPRELFVRISRHNIINMSNIKNVCGTRIEMINGEVLYVNDGRKKKFEKTYGEFLIENAQNCNRCSKKRNNFDKKRKADCQG